jgi:hypothetical protein
VLFVLSSLWLCLPILNLIFTFLRPWFVPIRLIFTVLRPSFAPFQPFTFLQIASAH